VLARGIIPADVLFVGEAPGASEDVVGVPFVGPAGKLLDKIVNSARELGDSDNRLAYAFSNLLACVPKDKSGEKIHDGGKIPVECINACAPRLNEFVQLCQPRLIVLVGALAKKHIYGQAQFDCDWIDELHFCEIIHPASILRMDISQKGLAVQRCVVIVSDALEAL